jgi:hypothetical protein
VWQQCPHFNESLCKHGTALVFTPNGASPHLFLPASSITMQSANHSNSFKNALEGDKPLILNFYRQHAPQHCAMPIDAIRSPTFPLHASHFQCVRILRRGPLHWPHFCPERLVASLSRASPNTVSPSVIRSTPHHYSMILECIY